MESGRLSEYKRIHFECNIVITSYLQIAILAEKAKSLVHYRLLGGKKTCGKILRIVVIITLNVRNLTKETEKTKHVRACSSFAPKHGFY